MDSVAIAGMIFSLLAIMMIGGFILLFPLSRRLGAVLEQRLREKDSAEASAEQIEELRRAVRSLEAEVRALSERQAFTDSLLDVPERPELEPGQRA